MIINLSYRNVPYECDLNQPIDISIPTGQVKCFHAPDFVATPLTAGDFIGSVEAGAPVNFYNVSFNPHGNGTHTECLGHITKERESVNRQLEKFHFIAYLATVEIRNSKNQDKVIELDMLLDSLPEQLPDAIIIRTNPNGEEKLNKNYSGTNPPYLGKEAMQYLVDQGVDHLLIDLPSVDREQDGGLLQAHRIFWNLNEDNPIINPRINCTITEMVFIHSSIPDGLYLLNVQIAPFNLDAAPSKPVIYKLYK